MKPSMDVQIVLYAILDKEGLEFTSEEVEEEPIVETQKKEELRCSSSFYLCSLFLCKITPQMYTFFFK